MNNEEIKKHIQTIKGDIQSVYSYYCLYLKGKISKECDALMYGDIEPNEAIDIIEGYVDGKYRLVSTCVMSDNQKRIAGNPIRIVSIEEGSVFVYKK